MEANWIKQILRRNCDVIEGNLQASQVLDEVESIQLTNGLKQKNYIAH